MVKILKQPFVSVSNLYFCSSQYSNYYFGNYLNLYFYYFHFLESIRNRESCQDALKKLYNTENIDLEKIIEQIKGNLLNIGVILND